MISKAKSIKGSSVSIEYIQNDKELGDAFELDRNGIISDKPNEIMQEFRLMQEANGRCDKNTISIVISPDYGQKHFNIQELKEIGQRHLKDLRLEKNQYLMTLHQSTGKPHIHIIANRIDEKGKALNDSFISKKCQEISATIDKEKGLLTAKDIQKVNEIALQPLKQEIKKAHKYSISRSNTFEEYKKNMHNKGITVKPTINKNKELQGMKFSHKQSGLDFKASEIGKNFGIKNLIENKIEMPNLSPPLQQIALKVVKMIAKTATKEMGIGF